MKYFDIRSTQNSPGMPDRLKMPFRKDAKRSNKRSRILAGDLTTGFDSYEHRNSNSLEHKRSTQREGSALDFLNSSTGERNAKRYL